MGIPDQKKKIMAIGFISLVEVPWNWFRTPAKAELYFQIEW